MPVWQGSLEFDTGGPISNADKAWLRKIVRVENIRRIHWKDVQGVQGCMARLTSHTAPKALRQMKR